MKNLNPSKKYIVLIIVVLSISFLQAQQLPLLTTEGDVSKAGTSSFKENTKNLEAYFSTRQVDKKGSGYKPFKRWENHWKHYLQADGTIAPAEHLWKAWEQKQVITKNQKVLFDSNWTDKGPFSQFSKSGQGRVNTVAVDPNIPSIIYAGAPAGGLWKSTDSGVNWIPLTDNLPQIGVSGIAIVPDANPNNPSQTIYLSTGDDDAGHSYSIGVLKSVDGGVSWNQTGTISANSTSSNEIILDPVDSNKIWVATDRGLFLSIDAGVSWTVKQSGHIRDFKLKPGDSNTIYAVSSNTFFISTDGGTTFTSTNDGLPFANDLGRLRVEVTPAAPDKVYLLAAKTNSNNYGFEGLYISDDSGTSFVKTNENSDIFGGSTQAWYDLAFSVSDTNPNILFVGVLDIWKSTDGGDNFAQINDWTTVNATYTHADIHFMRYFNGDLYAGTDGGIYKSTNDGTSFTDLTENISISQFYKVAVSKQSSNKLAGGLQDNGGFSLVNNQWYNYHGGDGMDSASDPNDENTFYGFIQFGRVLTATNDGGITSIGVASRNNQGNWVTPLVINKASEVYAGFNHLYKLNGNSWKKISNKFFGGNLDILEIDPSNNDNIFVSRGITLYKSTDKGDRFTTLNANSTGIEGVNISSIEVHSEDSNIVWLTTTGSYNNTSNFGSGDTGGGVYKSIDGGLTFTDISEGLPNESKFVIRHHPFSTNNSIYIGTALGVYHKNDAVETWEVYSTNLPNVAISDLEINPYDNTLTAATYGRSVWQSPIESFPQPAIDADLLSVGPNSDIFSCGSEINPTITVLNNGQNNLSNLSINYSIDGGANQTFDWSGSLISNSSTIINLPTISVVGTGEHTISAEIIAIDDTNMINNNSSTVFSIAPNSEGLIQTTYTFGDINPDINENPIEWLVSDDNLWEIGTPSTSILNGLAASAYVTNPTGNYPDLTRSYLTSPCYNLSILENPELRFKMAFDLEQNWDLVYVEYSLNQGLNWQILGDANDPNWYNSDRTAVSSGGTDCFNCPGAQWTGTDSELKSYSYNLSSLNNESNIIFRFTFVSDQSINNEGVVVDEFILDATKVLSVNDFDEGEFLIYPNPSSDSFNIKRFNTIGESMNLEVYDITGKLIRQKMNIIDGDYELNMTGISKGIYFLQVSIDDKRLVKKLVLN